MNKDIRDILKEETEVYIKLPENHREDFKQKLAKRNNKYSYSSMLKIAAALIAIITVSSLVIFNSKKDNTSNLNNEISAIESTYLKKIDSIWNNVNQKELDPELLNIYQPKLDELAQKYDTLTKQIKVQPNNINNLEALITNLQNRLRLLKEIEAHSKSSNQKYEHHEIIIL